MSCVSFGAWRGGVGCVSNPDATALQSQTRIKFHSLCKWMWVEFAQTPVCIHCSSNPVSIHFQVMKPVPIHQWMWIESIRIEPDWWAFTLKAIGPKAGLKQIRTPSVNGVQVRVFTLGLDLCV